MNELIGIRERRYNILFAWILILLVSDLPNIIWNGLYSKVPAWLFWAKVRVIAIFFGLYLLWKIIPPLWQFASVMLVFYLAFGLSDWVGKTFWWQFHFNRKNI